MAELLVEEYRGNIVENIHHGHICGVGFPGVIRYKVGNPDFVTYLRSSAKPFQAIPAFMHGFDEKFGFTDKEKTIMMASHHGESYHVQALDSMLNKIGIREDELICSPTYPLKASARDELVIRQEPKRRIYHNCSGKHLGVLSYCKGMGLSLHDYYEPRHPAQVRILEILSLLSECPVENIAIGIDGCGFPVFAIPLKHLAAAFLKLACPELITDSDIRTAVEKMTRLLNENYEMVSGTGLICSTLNRDPNIVAKGGAKGVYCFGLKEEKLAFALKVVDGSQEEWPLIVASILQQIGYKNTETIERMLHIAPPQIINDNNKIVGLNKAVFRLETV